MDNKFDMNDVRCEFMASVEARLENQHRRNVEYAIAIVRSANEEQMEKINAILFS